ncbi:MAG: hypothetical protein WBC72_15440, partial [Pseudolabrys sp.]
MTATSPGYWHYSEVRLPCCSRSSGSGRQLAAPIESGTDGLSLVLGYDEHRRSMGDRTTSGWDSPPVVFSRVAAWLARHPR